MMRISIADLVAQLERIETADLARITVDIARIEAKLDSLARGVRQQTRWLRVEVGLLAAVLLVLVFAALTVTP
jgi:hypothetical protein